MKEGIYTTEFWLSVGSIVAATVLCAIGKIDATVWAATVVPSAAGYTISRGIIKKG